MTLVIGNKRFSSWSLRPWLVMAYFKIPFEEKIIYLDQPTTTDEILKFSGAGKVPALVVEEHTIWDSLSICEYLNDKYPEKQMWPKDLLTRAWARSVSCEMHSGFQTMRDIMSHNLQTEHKLFVSQAANKDIVRVKEIWKQCLQKSGGPYLFGDFCIADAMYAPVVNRFISYAVPIEKEEDLIAKYMKTIRQLPAHKDWIEAGMKETVSAPLHK